MPPLKAKMTRLQRKFQRLECQKFEIAVEQGRLLERIHKLKQSARPSA